MLKDEDLYTKAMKEYDSGKIFLDLNTKALVLANGDKEMAKFQYVRLRVEQLKRDNLKKLPEDLAIGVFKGLQSVKRSHAESREIKSAEKVAKAVAKEKARLARKQERKAFPLVPVLIVISVFIIAFVIKSQS